MGTETKKAAAARAATTFYHVTTRERLASIASEGFDPAHSRTGNGLLYLTPDVGHALGYAGHHGDDADADLLRIRGADLDPAALGPDDVDLPDLVGDSWEGYDWLRSAKASGQCAYSGVVPAERIEARACPGGDPEGEWAPAADLAATFSSGSPVP